MDPRIPQLTTRFVRVNSCPRFTDYDPEDLFRDSSRRHSGAYSNPGIDLESRDLDERKSESSDSDSIEIEMHIEEMQTQMQNDYENGEDEIYQDPDCVSDIEEVLSEESIDLKEYAYTDSLREKLLFQRHFPYPVLPTYGTQRPMLKTSEHHEGLSEMSVIHEPVNSPISQTGKDMQNQNTVGEFNTTPPRLYEDNFISPPTSPEIRHSMNFHQSHRSSCINKVDPRLLSIASLSRHTGMMRGSARYSRKLSVLTTGTTMSTMSYYDHARFTEGGPEKIAIHFFKLLDTDTNEELDEWEFKAKLQILPADIDSHQFYLGLLGDSEGDSIRVEQVIKYANSCKENKLNLLRIMGYIKNTKSLTKAEAKRIVQNLFQLFDINHTGAMESLQILDFLEQAGLGEDDFRLKEFFYRLQEIGGMRNTQLNLRQFMALFEADHLCVSLFDRILKKKMKVPDLPTFANEVGQIFDKIKNMKIDESLYKPNNIFGTTDPNLFSVSICTVDGQEISFGNDDVEFDLTGCSIPISYLIACQQNGFDHVHHHLGREPSGKEMGALILKDHPSEEHSDRKVPHNPFIESGAIMTCALIKPEETSAHRFNEQVEAWCRLCASRIGFNNQAFLAHKATSFRQNCLGYMMREFHSFPEGTDLTSALDLFFQAKSLQSDTVKLARCAATLANGGLNPITQDTIFEAGDVRNCLSLMLSSGMKERSGAWGFDIGMPAKSGVSGCTMIVIPNKMGIAIYSPPVDHEGNSYKSIKFCEELISKYNFHQFDHLTGISDVHRGKDPTVTQSAKERKEMCQILFAAKNGERRELEKLNASGANIHRGDYDKRTGLHLAASEGNLNIVKFYALCANGDVNLLNLKDRWGRTPLDDAFYYNNIKIANFLQKHGGERSLQAKQFEKTSREEKSRYMVFQKHHSSQVGI